TFLDIDTINGLEKSQKEDPGAREAQKRLAEGGTKMVHGEAALEQAIKISTALFSGDVKQLTNEEIEQGFKDVPKFDMAQEEIGLVELLVNAGISSSKRQAREDINNGAIYIIDDRNKDEQNT